MQTTTTATGFRPLNRAYNTVFRPGRLSLGLVLPLERYETSPVPTLHRLVERAQLAESLGFSALWLRDIPLLVPSFGDAGQVHDPFVMLGLLAGLTDHIALGVASVVLPLRHPAHVAKAAASADVLSGGRVLLGVASGDRPDEYPALNLPFHDRGERFRAGVEYVQRMAHDRPVFDGTYGHFDGRFDMLPKPSAGRLPLLITGGSQQSPDWLARHGDGWLTYPRPIDQQARAVADWRARIDAAGLPDRPAMQSLYIDLDADANAAPRPIHLGWRLGPNALQAHLRSLEGIGINHVALNLRFNHMDVEQTLQRLAAEVLPAFAVVHEPMEATA